MSKRRYTAAEWRARAARELVARLRAGRDRKRAESGRCEGPRPFGTQPGEAPVVERIRQLRSQGVSLGKIAAALNADGCRTRGGKLWHGQQIKNILDRVQ
jgi:hypothetical protein